MIFGHNTNLKIGDATFHVQTEDRGETHALVDTVVYYRGRVLHRRTNAYFDLLPLNEDRLQALRLRLEDQHRTVIEDIKSGDLQLAIPPEMLKEAAAQQGTAGSAAQANPVAVPDSGTLFLELTNANSWLTGRQAKLQVTVREGSGAAVSGAQVRVEIEGSENGHAIQAQTGPEGQAQIEFEMPRIAGSPAALVIHAETQAARGQLRFALRTKPRVA
jgi:hypothetical protein